MSLSTQQRAIINERQVANLHAAQLLSARPKLAPVTSTPGTSIPTPLRLVHGDAPALAAPSVGQIPIFSIVAMDDYRFPITEARKGFGWKAGDYLRAQIIESQAVLTPAQGQSDIQISPTGRITLPVWVRLRLFIDATDQLFIQHSLPEDEASLTISSTAQLFLALTMPTNRSYQV